MATKTKHKVKPLTAKERELLQSCARFVLAGEWPWEYDDEATMASDIRVLESACDKLSMEGT